MTNTLHGYQPNLYVCLTCRQIHDEQTVGTCRVEGYERLYCDVPGCKGDVKLHVEE